VPTPQERAAYRQAIEDAVEARAKARAGGVDAVWRTLVQLQEEIRATLAGMPSEFDAARLPGLLRELDRHVDRWEEAAKDAVTPLYAGAVQEGALLVQLPLRVVGVDLGGALISDAVMQQVARYRAEKITNVTDVVRGKIEHEIRAVVLGGKSPMDAMLAIDGHLETGEARGIVSLRAEMQVRTEVGRLHSEAGQLQMERSLAAIPELEKSWRWSGRSRATHAAVNGQRRKVSEMYDVGGEQLPYPRSAEGSAANVIGCGCDSAPHVPGWSST
jgi:hypothetical protein